MIHSIKNTCHFWYIEINTQKLLANLQTDKWWSHGKFNTFDSHQAMFFGSLQNCIGFQVVGQARTFLGSMVGFDPADVLASWTNQLKILELVGWRDILDSIYLLNPQFWRHSLPKSSPSDDPHQRKMNERCAANSAMSKAIILSQSQNLTLVTPHVRAYSSRGGSIKITSNWWGFNDFRSNLVTAKFKENLKMSKLLNKI